MRHLAAPFRLRMCLLPMVATAALAACTGGGADAVSTSPSAVSPSSSVGGLSHPAGATVGCSSAAFPVDPKWKQKSAIAGPFGFYGLGRDFRRAHRSSAGGDLETKLPVIIEGSRAVTVRVPPDETGRVGLLYGPDPGGGENGWTVADVYTEITFVPCGSAKRTAWAGGLVLKGRAMITLDVLTPGATSPVAVRLGRLGQDGP